MREFGAKQGFQFENSTFCNFPTVCTTFQPFSAKCTSLYKTEVISPRSARFVILALGELVFSDFQQSAQVCPKKRFHPRIVVIFVLGAVLISNSQQSARVCTKQNFSARHWHVLAFTHWAHHFLAFSAKCASWCKTAFSVREQHVL